MTDMSAQTDAPSAEAEIAKFIEANANRFYGLCNLSAVKYFATEFAEAYAALRTAKQDGRIAHLQEDFECEIGAKNREFKRAETAVAKVAQLESERDTAKLTCVELSIERTDETKRANTTETALSEALEKIEELTNLITKLGKKN